MIYEYALEPELVATWTDRLVGRYFIESFGLGQPRVVSRYPDRWARLVWQAFQGTTDLERARMTELLARLSTNAVRRRNYVWDREQTWLTNAYSEHARIRFDAILARVNPADHAQTLVADDVDGGAALWARPRGVTISRSAVQMAAAAAAMLRVADEIIFVDPNFRPAEPRFRRPLEAFLRALAVIRPLGPPSRVELHVCLDEDRFGTREFFENDCRNRLPSCIPPGMRLVVLRLCQRPGGEQLHNRYILTNLGGMIFNTGLDDGDVGQTDDIALMDRQQHELRWSQHAGEPMAFDVPEGRVEIRSRNR